MRPLLLQNSATADYRDNCGWTSLILASRYRCPDVVRLLLESNASGFLGQKWLDSIEQYVTTLSPVICSTPLDLASSHGKLEISSLPPISGPNPNRQDSNNGWSSLHRAARNGHLQVQTVSILPSNWLTGKEM